MAAKLWFNADGVTVYQHTTNDNRFDEGWSETLEPGVHFGEGIAGGDLEGGTYSFPNDDISHISVPSGFEAEVFQHSPTEGNQTELGGLSSVFGEGDHNLGSDHSLNDEISEIHVYDLAANEGSGNGSGDGSDDDELTDEEEIALLEEQLRNQPPKSNMGIYIAVGAVAFLGIAYMLLRKKPVAAAATTAAPAAPAAAPTT